MTDLPREAQEVLRDLRLRARDAYLGKVVRHSKGKMAGRWGVVQEVRVDGEAGIMLKAPPYKNDLRRHLGVLESKSSCQWRPAVEFQVEGEEV